MISDRILLNNEIYEVSSIDLEAKEVKYVDYEEVYHNEFNRILKIAPFSELSFLRDTYADDIQDDRLYEGDLVVFEYFSSAVFEKMYLLGYIVVNESIWLKEHIRIAPIKLKKTSLKQLQKRKTVALNSQFDIVESCVKKYKHNLEDVNINTLNSLEYDRLLTIDLEAYFKKHLS